MDAEQAEYAKWVRRNDTPDATMLAAFRSRVEAIADGPLLSILMPVYNPRPEWLAEAIDSVIAQVYPNWELCIADDCSTDQEIPRLLSAYAARDARIRVTTRERNGHIAAASNTALAMAHGRWSVLMDHDDLLPPHALLVIAETALQFPAAKIIYSDEDKWDSETGLRCQPHFKPDWNPALFASYNYVSHIGVYDTGLLRAVGGFREGYEGAQDYDIALRCIERIDAADIVHVPQILYHWRRHAGSTAGDNASKPYAMDAGRRSLSEHFARCGRNAEVMTLANGLYAVKDANPLPDWHLMRVGGRSVARDMLGDTLAKLPADEVVVLLEDGCELPDAAGLAAMLGMAMQPDVGLVGSKLVSRDGRVVGGGLLTGLGRDLVCIHGGARANQTGYHERASLVQDVSMLDGGCLAAQVGTLVDAGIAEGYRSTRIMLIDLGLRVAAAGKRLLWLPAVVSHSRWPRPGSIRDGWMRWRRARDVERLAALWPDLSRPDPVFNPNLALGKHNRLRLAAHPRVGLQIPWFQQPGASRRSTRDESAQHPCVDR